MFAIESLASVGETYSSSRRVARACEFLLKRQMADGGWGESFKVHTGSFMTPEHMLTLTAVVRKRAICAQCTFAAHEYVVGCHRLVHRKISRCRTHQEGDGIDHVQAAARWSLAARACFGLRFWSSVLAADSENDAGER